MRIALVTNLKHDQLGLFYISASLKRAGHDVRYFFDNRNLARNLKKFSPDLVGFSALTGNHLWAQECAMRVKEILPGVKTILGGAHATYYPEIINFSGFDFICRGEGERTIVLLVRALEGGYDYTGIKGLWVKEGDIIYKNDFASLEENLDSIPFPDRSIYFLYHLYHFYPFILSSRGCPFDCTFCFEPVQRELMKGKGKYIRFRSPENVVKEAIEIKREFKVRSFEFVDDIFGMKLEWLRKFAKLWKEEINMPFHCNLRTDIVNEELVSLLSFAGCTSVAFGIESGNERVRNYLLKKDLSKESIIKAAELLHKYKIRIITYDIIGTPGETIDNIWDTVEINQEIKTDYASVALMQPYPGTKIHEISAQSGLLSEKPDINIFPWSLHDVTPINSKNQNILINVQKLFNLMVWFPRAERLLKLLVRFPVNPVFYMIFLLTHTYGLWVRIKKVPKIYLFRIIINVISNIFRHRFAIKRRVVSQ